jgi:hypothetical protein
MVHAYIDLGNLYAYYTHYNPVVSTVSVQPILTIITLYS